MSKVCWGILAVLAVTGCNMSDQELRERTGDAAVGVKRAAETASGRAKEAYDAAAEKGREAMKDAGEQLSDAALRTKVLAGFNLVAELDASNIRVEARGGKVFLSGTVPTELDKMKAEGVAYGVTGSTAKFESTIEVKN